MRLVRIFAEVASRIMTSRVVKTSFSASSLLFTALMISNSLELSLGVAFSRLVFLLLV